jgi:hypothetical protein
MCNRADFSVHETKAVRSSETLKMIYEPTRGLMFTALGTSDLKEGYTRNAFPSWLPALLDNWKMGITSESESLYDSPFTANQFVLATSPLRLTTSNFFSNLTLVVIVVM